MLSFKYFHNSRGFENWGISLGYSTALAGTRAAFGPIACEQKYLMDYKLNNVKGAKPYSFSFIVALI